MKDGIRAALEEVVARLGTWGLFHPQSDSVSMRVPGRPEMLWREPGRSAAAVEPLSLKGGKARVHAAVYRCRADAGAVLVGRGPWSEALDALGIVPPVLFDEQARHIGRTAPPVPEGDIGGLRRALSDGGNVAILGGRLLCIGTTGERMALNVEVFEKCAEAFVLALAAGGKVRAVPFWVRWIAGRRLRRDQKRAAESLAAGQKPAGTTAY